MISQANASWTKTLRRNIYQLFLIILILSAATIGYISWQVHSSNSVKDHLNSYHQKSSEHILRALKEIRLYKYHEAFDLLDQNSQTKFEMYIGQPNSEFSNVASTHIIENEITQLLEIHRRHSEGKFDSLIQELESKFSNLLKHQEDGAKETLPSKIILIDLVSLISPLDQLGKLHFSEQEIIEIQLDEMEKSQLWFFYIFTFFSILIGLLITRKELRAIEKLVKQEVDTSERIHLLSLAIDQSPVSVMITDDKINIVYVNQHFQDLTGYSSDEVIGKNPNILQSGFTESSVYKKIFEHITNGEPYDCELSNKKKNGEIYYENVHFAPISDSTGVIYNYIAIKEDITARKNAELKLIKSEVSLKKAQQIAQMGSWEFDIVDDHLTWSDEIYRIFQIDKNKFGATYEAFVETIHPDDRDIVEHAYLSSLKSKKPYKIEHRLLMKDGRIKYVRESCETYYDDLGNPLRSIGIVIDITERRIQEEHIKHQAYYDSLTNLPNRFLVLDRLEQLISESKRKSTLAAVLFIDLDDFKKVNDSLGHDTGDKLLIKASERLVNTVRGTDTVARLGGDEFLVLLTSFKKVSDIQPVLTKIMKQFRVPFKIDTRELVLTTSIGISLFPSDGESASTLLRNADSAMYNAKDQGRNRYSFFTDDMNQKVSRRLAIEEQLHGAVSRNEFSVHYQPQIDIKTGQIIGAEALVRWCNTILDDIYPDEFIPIAEQTGAIILLGEFVITQSLKQISQWQRTLNENLQIAINVSPRQFIDPNFVTFVKDAIIRCNVAPSTVEIEITEGVLLKGHSNIKNSLNDLRKFGIKLSMDDFGTGYSSLSYLRNYQFDVLKIDRCFISDITQNTHDQALVKATIVMAHNMGLQVVAEGVETTEQLSYLQSEKCNIAQGYLFSKPVPHEEMTKLLANQYNNGDSTLDTNVMNFYQGNSNHS
ncbi:EAL domain-containing protein [Vibrio sp. ZSDE26]|uniref:EAL domain-containing protein n=1 Tax=Vibrio amylolyticus TaxID=2847292 RepID=A0A9X1XND0_9VIBR|nr:GGDEF domain-containing phosphodiesterase [Vibrio amylolyticus]MCK6265113.1 EAL domain-containing protein [Vibrio amylolyticus]